MKFTLDAAGAQSAGQGIGSLFKAYALGPMYRQQAEQDTAAKLATTYAHNMQGNKYGAEAESERFTMDQRRGVDDAITADPAMAPYMANMMRAFKLTGDTNAHRVAQAGTEFQTQGLRDKALAAPDVETMNRVLSVAAEKPYLPHDNVGTSGYSINKATGAQVEANPIIAKIFQMAEQAKVNQHNAAAGASGAQAGLSSARRDRVVSGLDKPVTIVDEDTGQATVTTLPTRGAPVSIGVAPSKGSGEAATNAKARNAVVSAVEKELGTTATDREIQAEVERRMSRRTGNKSPAPAATAPKMQLPQGYTPQKALDAAKVAIASGKDRAAVIKRLQEMGVEPKGL